MKKTKIVCTLGPSVDCEKKLKELIEAGMDVARFNFSHGDHDSQQKRVDRLNRVKSLTNKPVALLLDTKGPEIRIGKFENGGINLEPGAEFRLVVEETLGTDKKVSITHKELYNDVTNGTVILLNDGLVSLKVDNVSGTDIVCKVVDGGVLVNNKGINIPDTDTHLPSLTEQDINDIMFAVKNNFDYIAASFVRKAGDIIAVRKILEDNNASSIKIIAKIENREGVNNFDDILRVSDGIMVARGDLGVEIPVAEVPSIQKYICRRCREENKVVIVATQMLESMISNPRPTRAEVSDVANAIYDGTSAIMLSGESAAGKYPVESVKTMAQIAEKTEESLDYSNIELGYKHEYSIGNAVGSSSVVTARLLGASSIVCVTESGETAKFISNLRAECPVIAVTSDEKVLRQMMLYWGIIPVMQDCDDGADDMINKGIKCVKDLGIVKEGDVVVITSGSKRFETGATNIMKVHKI